MTDPHATPDRAARPDRAERWAVEVAGDANAEFKKAIEDAIRSAYHYGYCDGQVSEYDKEMGL